MNKLLFVAVILLVSFLSYVVYAVTQPANQGKSANEIIASLMSPEAEKVAHEHGKVGQIAAEPEAVANPKYLVLKQEPVTTKEPQTRMMEAVAEKTPLQLEIKAANDEQQAWIRQIEMTFTNTSEEPVKIIKPLDGSYYGWYQPHYKFSVLNAEGKEMELSGRCGLSGLWADTIFPDDYLVEINPEQTHEISGYLPFMIPETGDYSVTFEYIYNCENNKASAPKNGADFDWTRPLDGVWRGTIKSNTITLKLEKNN